MSNLATIVNNILADSGIDDINVVVTTGSYTNPSWIVSLPWTKITGAPSFQLLSEKGQPNGYASLDSNGKVPLVQINDALIGNVNFQGLWNAATNTPTLANPPASGTKGNYYIVSTAGTFAGISFEVGDWIISDGTAWGKVDNTDAVSSVFGRTGNVTAANGDYTTAQVTESGNLYYTDGRARGALSFVAGSGAYNSSTGVITIPTNNNQITNGAGYITSAALGAYLPLTGGTLTGPLISSFNTGGEPFVNATFSGVGGSNIGGILVNGTAQAHVRFLVGSNTWDGAGAKQWQIRVGAGASADDFRIYSWTYGNDIFYINGATGNVGINNAPDPSSKLIITSTDIHPNVLRLENNNTTANEAGIRMRATNSTGTAFAHADIGVYATGSDTGNFFIKFPYSNDKQTNVRLSIDQTGAATFSSSVTASSIIRSGGTSSQFLMADGTVNTSVLPSGAYLPLAGGTLTGTLTISGLGYGNTLVITTDSTNGADIRLTNTSAGGKIYNITSTGSTNALGVGGLQFYNETDGVVAFGYTSSRNFLINTDSDNGSRLRVNGTGWFDLGITANGASAVNGTLTISAGTTAEFAFGVNSDSTFAFGSTNGRRGAIIAHNTVGDSGLQFGWDTVDKTGIIAGSANVTGAGIDFYTYNGSAWGNRVRIPLSGGLESLGAFYTGGTRSGSMSNIYSSSNNIFYAQSSASGIQAAGTNSVTNGSIVITNTGGTGAYSIIGNSGIASGYGLFIQSQDRTAAQYYPLLLQPNGGNVGINIVSPVQTLTVRGVFGAPSTSGAAQNGIARFGQAAGNGCLDFGFGDPYSWLQSRLASDYSTNFALALNPNGGNVLVGTTNDVGAKFYVDGGIRASGAFIGAGLLEFVGAWSASPYNGSSWIRAANGVGLFLVNNAITRWAGFTPSSDFDINSGAFWVKSSNGNVGMGTNNPLGSINNLGLQIDRGGHATLLIGNGTGNGGVVQSSDNTRRVFIGANVYDDDINSWSQFVDLAGYAAFDAIGGDTSGLSRILVGSPADSGYGGGNVFFEAYKDNSTSYVRLRTNTDNALFISNAGRTILGSESDNGYKFQVIGGNIWANGVRIGRDFSITNRATVRLDSNGDEPADILFGRTAAALETSWNGVFWSLSSRGSGEGNNFRIYRGPANTGGSEIIALNINPSAGAATFINTVTATAFFESSDKRLKSNILDLEVNVSSIIAKTYLKNGVEEIGYLAQDVENILPSAISKRDDGYLDLSYRQVHTAKIAYLEKRITELEQQLKNK